MSFGNDVLGFVPNWDVDTPIAIVTLSPNIAWGGFVHLEPFNSRSVKHGVTTAFAIMPEFSLTLITYASCIFYKMAIKQKDCGSYQCFYLDPYFQCIGVFYGILSTNANAIYCPKINIIPSNALSTYIHWLSDTRPNVPSNINYGLISMNELCFNCLSKNGTLIV